MAQPAPVKRFYTETGTALQPDGWSVTLNTRPIRTQGGHPQRVPTQALARLLETEWAAQGEEIDPKSFPLRDMADYAQDYIGQNRASVIDGVLAFAETDTLCYFAGADEALYLRQQEQWEPLLLSAQERYGVAFERISGIMHRPQPEQTLARLRAVLESLDDLTLAAVNTLSSIAASLIVGLAALDPQADGEALFAAANAEEDWQAEQWGWEWTAEEKRGLRLEAFLTAMAFAAAVRS